MATAFPIPNSKLTNFDDPTKDLKFKFKQINADYKKLADELQKFLIDFFQTNAYPQKNSDEAMFYFANKLGSNLVSFISEKQSKPADEKEISSHKIDGKTIEKYISDIFAKDIGEINSAIQGHTFTASELDSFKAEVLKSISDAIDDSFKRSQPEIPKTDAAEIFKKHSFLFTSKNIYLPKIDFEKINTFLKNGVFRKFSNESKAYVSRLTEKSNRKIRQDSKVLSDYEVFRKWLRGLKEHPVIKRIKEVKEKFLNDTIPSFRNLHFRLSRFEARLEKLSKVDLKRTLKKFGRKMAMKLKLAIAFFFPISEVLLLAKAATKIISFTLKSVNFVYSAFKKVVGFVSKIGKTAMHVLSKSLSIVYKSAKFVFTAKIFRAFFSTYIGAYVLGYGIGFIYKNLKKYFEAAKELYDDAKRKISEIYGEHSEEIEDLKRRASEFSLSVSQTLGAIGYTAEDFAMRLFEDKDFDSALRDSLNKLRDEGTGASLGLGTDLLKISEAINKFFTLSNLKTIIEAAKSSIAAGVAGFLGSAVGSMIGGAIGTAIAGPFGTIPGALIGSFVGEWLTSFLFPRTKKIESLETDYQRYTRLSFGRTSEFSSIGEFDLGNNSAKDRIDEIYRKTVLGSKLEKEDIEFLKARSISATDPEKLASVLEGMSSIYDVSNRLVTEEISSAQALLAKLGEENKFKNDAMSKDSRTTLLKLFNGSNEIKDDLFNESDRLALVYRIYRAIAIGNMIPKLYERRADYTEDDFLRDYRQLDTPNIEARTYGEALRSYLLTMDQSLLEDYNIERKLQMLINVGGAGIVPDVGTTSTSDLLKDISNTLNSQEYGFGISSSRIKEHYRGEDRTLDDISDSQLRKTTRMIENRNSQSLADLQKLFENQDVKNDLPAILAINRRLFELQRDIGKLDLSGIDLERYRTQLWIFQKKVSEASRNIALKDAIPAAQ